MRIRELRQLTDLSLEGTMFRGCWEFELLPGEATVSHQHDDADELSIVIEGEGAVVIDGDVRAVRSGDAIYVPSGTRHEFRNSSDVPLRGVTIEQRNATLPDLEGFAGAPTIGDLERLIREIPEDLDTADALQSIIRLFDLAGYISEHIDESIGLDNESGLEALRAIENRVMDAVVEISARYQLGIPSRAPRF